jgi:nitrogen regulatory protein P-II 1
MIVLVTSMIYQTDADLERILGVIAEAARSGKLGDGKIFVSTVDEAIRIRNGDRGQLAL